MKRRSGWIERLAEQTDMHDELFPAQPLVELLGDGRVLIEHHKGVTAYGRNEICVRMKYGTLQICGCSLELSQMSAHQLVITGRIDGMKIERGGRR